MSLREKILDAINECKLMQGREKMQIKNLIGQTLTWRDFEMASVRDRETGELKEIPVVIFDEYPNNFCLGGSSFQTIVSILDENDIAELRRDGLKIRLDNIDIQGGKHFTKVSLID